MQVVIPEEYFSPLDPERSDVPTAYTPSVSLRLLSDAAYILGHTPDATFSIHPTYRPYTNGGAGSDMLLDVIHQTEHGTRNPFAPKFDAMSGGQESCSKAEARLLQAIRHPEYPAEEEQSVRVVVDESGKPLLIQKNIGHRIKGVSLALSLGSLNIGPVTWDAGMLLQVSTPHRVENAEPVTTIQPKQVSKLAVLRASLFALPAYERISFLSCPSRFSETDARVMGRITMDEIRDSVHELIRR